MDDKIFGEEQAHLTATYETLQRIHDNLDEQITTTQAQAAQDLRDLSAEIRPDTHGIEADEILESLAAIETLNAVIDAYNQAHDLTLDKLRRTLLLLNQPYFAKVSLEMRPGRPARDVYIGVAGMMDEERNPIVVDWRSPVAETYYNQQMGPTSYLVNGKERKVNLLLRRQFSLDRAELLGYFDTDVAIQDSLLLDALRRHHSEKLQDITATIQREQNEVVRHADVPCLIVNGIAGSGKTSVLLQRIAYLFYQERDTLSPDQVCLFSPNEVFASYIDQVLPSLGEANPHVLTWRAFAAEQGARDRNDGRGTAPEELRALAEAVPGLRFDERDFGPIVLHDETLLTAAQIKKASEKYEQFPVGSRRMTLTREELHRLLERKMGRMARSDDMQEAMFALDMEEQVQVFGETVDPSNDEEVEQLTRRYVEWRFGDAHDLIDSAGWLRIDAIGERICGHGLNAAEWIWLRDAINGAGGTGTRFVMIDEVQDYTVAQLMVLARHFGRAHFLLLGDEHQAIFADSARFDQMREVFGETCGQVDECRLLTSYRSSPEITELFSGLVLDDEQGKSLSSVREGGVAPRMVACLETPVYLDAVRAAITQAADAEGLTAVVCAERPRVRWLAKQLGEEARVLGPHDPLPATGVVILDLPLAKGLEFDRVIVADASAEVYPDTPLARRQLYTCISRAMHEVTLISQGPLSPLLG